MEYEAKIESLEDEVKVIKAELKETLVGVRDFLYRAKPLPVENGTSLNNGSNQQLDAGSNASNNGGCEQDGSSPNTGDESDIPLTDAKSNALDQEMPDETSPAEQDGFDNSEDLTLEEALQSMLEEISSLLNEGGNMKESEAVNQGNSQVNLLVNLIHWVSVAKKDIGIDRLANFLDIYGISRQLPSGLKELILLLADTVEERSTDANLADNWTRLTLELHGILAGGTPFYPSENIVDETNTETQLLNIIDRLHVVKTKAEEKRIPCNGNGNEKLRNISNAVKAARKSG